MNATRWRVPLTCACTATVWIGSTVPVAGSSNGTVRRSATATVTGTGGVGGGFFSAQAASSRASQAQQADLTEFLIVEASWVRNPAQGATSCRLAASRTPASCASWASDVFHSSRASTCWARASASAVWAASRSSTDAHPGPIAAERHLVRLARAGDEIFGGADSPGRGLQGVIGAEHLEDDLLPQRVGPRGCRIRQGDGPPLIVEPGEAGE